MTALQLPAHLQGRASRGIAQQLRQSLPTGNVPYLSIKGGAFTLVDAAGNERRVGALDDKLGIYLDVCVVDSNPHVSKIYYANAFDPNAEAFMPPTCFSDNGVAPSSQAVKAQHKNCRECPHNRWGSETSRVTGKSTKACNDVQKVAIAIPGQGDMVFLLRVPPASLKHLGKYVQEVTSFSAGDRRVDISDLITRIHFQRDAVGVLGFTAAGWVDAATMAIADKVWETKAADQLVGKNDQPYTGEIGLPAVRPTQGHALPPPSPLMPQPVAQNPFNPPAAVPAGVEEAPKRRGRKPKEAVQEVPATQAPFMAQVQPQATNGAPFPPSGTSQTSDGEEDIPPFLQRIEGAPGMQAAPKPAAPSFGMQAPAAAPDDMQARIAAVLAMKTGG